jgi:hypothetical protein
MRGRDAAALRVVALVLLVLSAGCGGAGGGGSSAGDGSSAGGGVSTGGPKLTPDVIRYMEYIKRCHQATRELAEANVIYDPDMEMTLKESKTVTALVTLNTKIPPDQLLPNRGAKADAIYVACEIEARLSGGVDEFTIQPADWQSRSLVGTQDAKWTWIVAPQVGGTRSLVMELRPIVKRENRSKGGTNSEILTTASFESTVHIKVPADQRISDMAIRSRVVFNDLTGAAKALYALVLAIFVLAGVLGGRSLKQRLGRRRKAGAAEK